MQREEAQLNIPIGAKRTKRLLNTVQSAGRLADSDNCSHNGKGKEIHKTQRNNSAESCYEITREDTRQEEEYVEIVQDMYRSSKTQVVTQNRNTEYFPIDSAGSTA